MFCSRCGKKNEDGAEFCSYCGFRIKPIKTEVDRYLQKTAGNIKVSYDRGRAF